MQSPGSIGRAVYRVTFRRGSPQRIHYSPSLAISALVAFVVLAAMSQLYVFGDDWVGVLLYLFTWTSGLWLGTAFLSRRVSRSRLRQCVQATLLIVAAGHLVLLMAAPLVAVMGQFGYVAGAAVGVGVIMGLVNCVQFALETSRARATFQTLIFASAVAAFYATMHTLLEIALV